MPRLRDLLLGPTNTRRRGLAGAGGIAVTLLLVMSACLRALPAESTAVGVAAGDGNAAAWPRTHTQRWIDTVATGGETNTAVPPAATRTHTQMWHDGDTRTYAAEPANHSALGETYYTPPAPRAAREKAAAAVDETVTEKATEVVTEEATEVEATEETEQEEVVQEVLPETVPAAAVESWFLDLLAAAPMETDDCSGAAVEEAKAAGEMEVVEAMLQRAAELEATADAPTTPPPLLLAPPTTPLLLAPPVATSVQQPETVTVEEVIMAVSMDVPSPVPAADAAASLADEAVLPFRDLLALDPASECFGPAWVWGAEGFTDVDDLTARGAAHAAAAGNAPPSSIGAALSDLSLPAAPATEVPTAAPKVPTAAPVAVQMGASLLTPPPPGYLAWRTANDSRGEGRLGRRQQQQLAWSKRDLHLLHQQLWRSAVAAEAARAAAIHRAPQFPRVPSKCLLSAPRTHGEWMDNSTAAPAAPPPPPTMFSFGDVTARGYGARGRYLQQRRAAHQEAPTTTLPAEEEVLAAVEAAVEEVEVEEAQTETVDLVPALEVDASFVDLLSLDPMSTCFGPAWVWGAEAQCVAEDAPQPEQSMMVAPTVMLLLAPPRAGTPAAMPPAMAAAAFSASALALAAPAHTLGDLGGVAAPPRALVSDGVDALGCPAVGAWVHAGLRLTISSPRLAPVPTTTALAAPALAAPALATSVRVIGCAGPLVASGSARDRLATAGSRSPTSRGKASCWPRLLVWRRRLLDCRRGSCCGWRHIWEGGLLLERRAPWGLACGCLR